MRVLALSPGPLRDQLKRLPAMATICSSLDATLQVACDPSGKAVWTMLPAMEKLIPFNFEDNPTLADWANLLGCVREPDFQICLNFAEGQQVNLMLSMSHIPTRIAGSGFACTDKVSIGTGWPAQSLDSWLQPLGLELDAEGFRLVLPTSELDQVRTEQPSGDGPLLLMASNGEAWDWPDNSWSGLPDAIHTRLPDLRTVNLSPQLPLRRKAAAVACADVVLSSCPVTQLLAVYCGVPLVALGAAQETLPERSDLRCLGEARSLSMLQQAEVLSALGF